MHYLHKYHSAHLPLKKQEPQLIDNNLTYFKFQKIKFG